MSEDQDDRRNPDFYSQSETNRKKIIDREFSRAKKASNILQTIKTPSVKNIGMDGSRALWLLALHNCDIENLGERMLHAMRRLYYRDSESVFSPGIPYLADRVRIYKSDFSHNVKLWYNTQKWIQVLPDGSHVSGSYGLLSRKKLPERLRRFNIHPKKNCNHF